jgi:ATP phosphoribosyltransferase
MPLRRHGPRHLATLTIALAKGRILDETLPLFAQAGIVADEDPRDFAQADPRDERADVRS